MCHSHLLLVFWRIYRLFRMSDGSGYLTGIESCIFQRDTAKQYYASEAAQTWRSTMTYTLCKAGYGPWSNAHSAHRLSSLINRPSIGIFSISFYYQKPLQKVFILLHYKSIVLISLSLFRSSALISEFKPGFSLTLPVYHLLARVNKVALSRCSAHLTRSSC